MNAIMNAIEDVRTLIGKIKSEEKSLIMIDIGRLANTIEITINSGEIWNKDDLNKFNEIMKQVLESIENNDFQFAAYVLENNLLSILKNIIQNYTMEEERLEEIDYTTMKIKEQYTDFPYPNLWRGKIPLDTIESVKQKKLITGLYNIEYIQQIAFEKFIPLNKVRVLVAGCGTGEGAILSALAFPTVKYTFVDISISSLNMAQKYVDELLLENVEIIEADIMRMDLERKFDIIISTGVIHHLSNPSIGVTNLKKHLEDYGVLSAMVYGEYGRFEIGLFQDALKILLGDKFKFGDGINLVKSFIDNIDSAKNRITNIMWKEDIDKGDQHIVDLLLNVNENRYNIKSLDNMLKQAGMNLFEVISNDTFNPSNYVTDEVLKEKFNQLSYIDKCSLAEKINGRITMINFYAIKEENDFSKLSIKDEKANEYYINKSPYLIKKTIAEGNNKKYYILINPTCRYEESGNTPFEIEIDTTLWNFLELCNGKNKVGSIFKKFKGNINEDIAKKFIEEAVNQRMLILHK